MYKDAIHTNRVFITTAPNKDSEYRIEKEKYRLQKMVKMRENVKKLIEQKMVELSIKQKVIIYIIINYFRKIKTDL